MQLDSVKNGDFTEQELEIAKSFIINSYNSYLDSPYMLKDYYYSQNFSHNSDTLEQASQKVTAVTKQDVVEAFSAIKTDTVYFLKGKEE